MRKLLFIVLMLSILFAPIGLTSSVAQESERTLVYTFSTEMGELQLHYPSEWVVEESNGILNILGRMLVPDSLSEAEATLKVSMISPEERLSMGVNPTATVSPLMDAILKNNVLVDITYLQNKPFGLRPAAIGYGQNETSVRRVYLVDFGDGYAALIESTFGLNGGDLLEIQVEQIGRSMTFTPSDILESGETYLRQWAIEATSSSEFDGAISSADQALGVANTTECAPSPLAWTTVDPDGVETIRLSYAIPVYPTHINIYQNVNPGTITGVDLITDDEVISLTVEASDIFCPGIVSVEILDDIRESINAPIQDIVVVMDQSQSETYSQIDAVELVGLTAEPYLYQWASDAKATTEYTTTYWSALQATGAPNTDICGDIGTAWASESATGQDTLTVQFTTPVYPHFINIYQSYNPGAITSIDLMDANGDKVVLNLPIEESGSYCPGVLSIPITEVDELVSGVRLNFDQRLTGDWNEIDAVQLVGTLTIE